MLYFPLVLPSGLSLIINDLHPGLPLLKFDFGEPKPGHSSVLPALHCHLEHSCTTTVVFEVFHHLYVLPCGCQLPRLAEYLELSIVPN